MNQQLHYREYRTIDKTSWGDGPWQNEPDKVQFTDDNTGMPCLIVRNRNGALCGYVGVDAKHPYFKVDYMVIEDDIEVHGHLTFSAPCQEHGDQSQNVCHIPNPGEPDDIWWLGFDCAHNCDYSPGFMKFAKSPEEKALFSPHWGEIYRDMVYVTDQCRNLAAQLKAKVDNAIE